MDKKTPKPKVKSVSFKYKHFDCYDYIKDMSNFSDYICDLIRLDMEAMFASLANWSHPHKGLCTPPCRAC